MKKIGLSVIAVMILFNMCSCSNEEAIETMFEISETSFYDYEEYTEQTTVTEISEISDVSQILDTLELKRSESVQTTETTTTAVNTTVNTTASTTATANITSISAETTSSEVTESVFDTDDDFVCIDVPFISQNDEYPTGCELVSAEMLLNFYGFDITAGELIDKGYIKQTELEIDYDDKNKVYGGDPNKSFIGDPRTESGYGCYAPAIFEGLEKYLDGKYFDASNLSGISLPDLCMEYIDFGEPVMIWASINMSETKISEKPWIIKETGEKFRWISNEHCLVLVGYDSEYYYFNDPQKNKAVPYKKETAEKRYKELGSQAVTIRPW